MIQNGSCKSLYHGDCWLPSNRRPRVATGQVVTSWSCILQCSHHPMPRNAWSPVTSARRFFSCSQAETSTGFPWSPCPHTPSLNDSWSWSMMFQHSKILCFVLARHNNHNIPAGATWNNCTLNRTEWCWTTPSYPPDRSSRLKASLPYPCALRGVLRNTSAWWSSCADASSTSQDVGGLESENWFNQVTRCLAIFWGRWTNRWNQGPSFQTDLIVNIDSGCGPAFLFSLAFWACQCRSFRPIDVPEKRSG